MKILITGGSGFIGTNAVQHFKEEDHEILNLDALPPLDKKHLGFWRKCDILSPEDLEAAFKGFQPEAVIHLAARAECDENTTVEEGYRANTVGTQNVLDAIKSAPSVRRAVIVSSQFVCGPEHPPAHDEDFHPITVYGRSKVITEELTRQAGLGCIWTIVRPTNIWGPWHQRYIREFWKIAGKGLYVHPGGKPVIRCYGYVGNLVHHLGVILTSDEKTVHGKVFYLSDPADDIHRWANAFCVGLSGKPARRVPRPLLQALGLAGDAISSLTGKPFYITSSRYRSMTSDYLVPGAIENTMTALGSPKFSLEEGVERTTRWLKEQQKETRSENPAQ